MPLTAHPLDSGLYGHLWGTAELRDRFDDQGRVQAWLEILAALAEAQAEVGLVPVDAARQIRVHARVELLDLREVAEQTRATSHSTLGLIVERDLRRAETAALALARRHRDTVMCGRTHGQPGLPITFGFKAAVWVSELRRHQERLAQARPRYEVVQLAGALGTMEFWGDRAIE